jgi:hypothetical protein
MNGPDIKLLDATKLARELGVSTWVLKGIKIAAVATGDSPFRGRFSTVAWLLDWLERHPEFVASHHLRYPREAGRPARTAYPAESCAVSELSP